MVERNDDQLLDELDCCRFMCSKCHTLFSHQNELEQHWTNVHPKTQWSERKSIVERTDLMRRLDIEAFKRWKKLVKDTHTGITALVKRQQIAIRAMQNLEKQQRGPNQRQRRRNQLQATRAQPPATRTQPTASKAAPDPTA